MAPINPDLQNVQEDIKNVIQDLYQVMVQVSNYDGAGRPTRDVLSQDIQTLDASLLTLYRDAQRLPTLPPSTSPSTTAPETNPSYAAAAAPKSADRAVPEPLIQYVENGRNPDIYTREFAELVRRMNQLARGKTHAFRDFRDVLAREMMGALPELREDVEAVVRATGGVTTEVGVAEAGAGEQGGTSGQQQQQQQQQQ
ncbi:mediator of RNA polymerase II transcription subunit 10 [Chaetomium sp. MPI-SDFR-AT-0129]|uniref:Mediator of RNA polymerase II transcription subunit 10 n=1 Tax=Dichotomopilus funicola TaxID=1934379 RepID=A0AAN6ZMG4_9PEZI|nr:mediator of RNA polymerase II transcription subunit 10 [Chaetomium sp. MPI-SDFR-AT-0129]KAK4143887.1 transcription factor subunit Med10 of mediator complex-domain-containing protein [Dichotomopilus funicola]